MAGQVIRKRVVHNRTRKLGLNRKGRKRELIYRRRPGKKAGRKMLNVAIQPPRGIHNYGNTCYLNATIKLLKNIPGLQFNNPAFDCVYKAREEDITGTMVWNMVQQCGFRRGAQNDAVELSMILLGDVVTKERFEISWELEHYIMNVRDSLPLFDGLTNKVKITRRPDKAYQYRLVNLSDRTYPKIQDMMNEFHFSAGGPGDCSIQTDFNDSDYSPNDYVWKNGVKTNLRKIISEAGTSTLPTCKREVYTPTSDYVIVTLDTVDFIHRTKKSSLNITDILAPIRFTSGMSYALTSIVCHIGSNITSGHYINYTLDQGSWSLYNDNQVTRHLNMNVINGSPYMLLYRQI